MLTCQTFNEMLKDVIDRPHQIQFLLCIITFPPECWWVMETVTNMEHCCKIWYAAEFPDSNLKINYACVKYVGEKSPGKKSERNWED